MAGPNFPHWFTRLANQLYSSVYLICAWSLVQFIRSLSLRASLERHQRLYRRTPAKDFGPKALKAVRQHLLEKRAPRKKNGKTSAEEPEPRSGPLRAVACIWQKKRIP